MQQSGVFSGQVDVFPSQRRDVRKEFDRNLKAGFVPGQDGLAQFQRVPVDDDRGQQVEASDSVMLTLFGSVAQFAALVEVDGALQGLMGLTLVQSDLRAPAHVGVRGPVDHEQRALNAADFAQSGRQLVLAGIRGEFAQDLCQGRRETRPKGGAKHCHRGRRGEMVRGGRDEAGGGVSRKRREGVARAQFPAGGDAQIRL